MSVPIQEAAEALVPFLSTGADVATRELASKAGSSFARAALHLIEKIKGSLEGSPSNVGEIEEALQTGLADGTISAGEIRAVVSVQSTGRDSWNIQAGRDVNIGTTQHIDGDVHG